jgi:hypothetical protein
MDHALRHDHAFLGLELEGAIFQRSVTARTIAGTSTVVSGSNLMSRKVA